MTAPGPASPLQYLVAAAIAFVLASAGVPWLAGELAGHYYHPKVVALTHAVTLGWITLAIMGASYHVLPAVLGRPIWSERLARWQFLAMAGGIIGVVSHFYIVEWVGLLWAASILLLGVAAHLVNVALSLRGLDRWTLAGRLMAVALPGLALTAVFGTLLAADRVSKFLPGPFFPTLHAHFHLALTAWIMPVILGLSSHLYPVFLLAMEPAGRSARVQVWGVVAGPPLLTAGLLTTPALVAAGALALAAAAAAHVAWVTGSARSGRRSSLDWGTRLALTGTAFLAGGTLVGLGFASGVISGPRAGLAYATLVLGGWASLTIAGMLLKIVPSLVWKRRYAPLAGRIAVPSAAQLSWPGAERLAGFLLIGGVTLLAAALAAGHVGGIGLGGAAVAAGALAWLAALARTLHHLVRPASGEPGA